MKTRPGSATYAPPAGYGVAPSAAVDPGITSLVDLAAVATTNLIAPTIRIWIMAADGTLQTWQLLTSTATTSEGVQRPNDYSALRPLVWFRAAS